MTYDEISPILRAYLGTWQVLRQVGFSSESLHPMTARSARHGGVLSLFLQLEAQGKEFSVELGEIKSEDETMQEFIRVAKRMNELSEGDLRRIMEESEACRDKVLLFMALMDKGFVIPADGEKAARA
jgi:hypothetical protein